MFKKKIKDIIEIDEKVEDTMKSVDVKSEEKKDIVEEESKNVEKVLGESSVELKAEDQNEVINSHFPTRGFLTYKDAVKFSQRPQFEKLGNADQNEFLDWLDKIK